jgi:hypothetical protein
MSDQHEPIDTDPVDEPEATEPEDDDPESYGERLGEGSQ